MSDDIVILGGARTAIGTFGGSLAAVPPIDLATTASKAALERSGECRAQRPDAGRQWFLTFNLDR